MPPVIAGEEAEETSVRDDIAATINKLENPEGGDKGGDKGGTPAKPAAGDPKFDLNLEKPAAPTSGTPAAGTPPAKPGQPGAAPAAEAGASTGAPAAGASAASAIVHKMPQSWKPAMSSRWEAMGKMEGGVELQESILKREREVLGALQTSAEARQFLGEFNKIAAPFSQFISVHAKGNPLGAFGDYLRTATLLRTGSPVERANAVAMAIQEYGVDVNLLDRSLAHIMRGGRVAVPAGGQPQLQQFHDPRVDALIARLDGKENASTAAEYDAFAADPKNEFFEQVRESMADYMDLQASKNIQVTLKQAYDWACKYDDKVIATLAERKAKADLETGRQKTAAARAARTPGAGAAAPASGVTAAGTGTMSDDIRAAIDKLTE